jgi:hypothetical protein
MSDDVTDYVRMIAVDLLDEIIAEARDAGSALINSKNLEAAMRSLFKAGKIWNEPYCKTSRPHFRTALKP